MKFCSFGALHLTLQYPQRQLKQWREFRPVHLRATSDGGTERSRLRVDRRKPRRVNQRGNWPAAWDLPRARHEGHMSRTILAMLEAEEVVVQDKESKAWSLRKPEGWKPVARP
jgi:hypothetical protein